MSNNTGGLTWDLIQEARTRIKGKVHRTPVMTSETLDSLAGAWGWTAGAFSWERERWPPR